MTFWSGKWRPLERGVTRRDVVAAYSTILGRPPESKAVIEAHLGHSSVWNLIAAITNSDEFKQRTNKKSSDYYDLAWRRHAPPLTIDCEMHTDDICTKLVHRIRQTWNRLGEEEPYFSVVTDSQFLTQNSAFDCQAFYELGVNDAQLVRNSLARAHTDIMKLNTCVEFGCGVGRATWQLGRLFNKVIAVDVSESHINIARKWLSSLDIKNVELRTIDGLIVYKEDHDFWFSRFVLQHNPPPLILRIITEALLHLRHGGCALFQLPTYIKNYQFDLNTYLSSFGDPGQMEMHCVPQQAIIDVINATGCEIIEIVEDQDVGAPQTMISNTLLVKNSRPRTLS